MSWATRNITIVEVELCQGRKQLVHGVCLEVASRRRKMKTGESQKIILRKLLSLDHSSTLEKHG